MRGIKRWIFGIALGCVAVAGGAWAAEPMVFAVGPDGVRIIRVSADPNPGS